jgi:hypothetical protein
LSGHSIIAQHHCDRVIHIWNHVAFSARQLGVLLTLLILLTALLIAKMPGPFQVLYLFQSYDGGLDLQEGCDYGKRGQWFAKWHTTSRNWWADAKWKFEGWMFYPNVPFLELSAEEWEFASSTQDYLWSEFLESGGSPIWGEGMGDAKGYGKGTAKGKGKGKGKGFRRRRATKGQGKAK